MLSRLAAQGSGPWLAAIAIIAGIALPWVMYTGLATQVIIWALFAIGFDLLLGYAGLLSFGHALFWGGSSYVVGITLMHWHVGFVPALLIGTLSAALMAALVGWVSIRRQGIYFAMITLAFGQLLAFFANELQDITGGENGLQGVPRPDLFGLSLADDRTFYYVALVVTALGAWFALRVVRSPFGQALAAIRENETRALGLGYRAHVYKFAAFVISGALAGAAGSLYVMAEKFTSLDTVNWHTSGEVVIMTVLGGIGTIFGPMLGALIYLLVNDRLSTFTSSPGFFLGLLFIIVVSLFRRGIVGELQHLWSRVGVQRHAGSQVH